MLWSCCPLTPIDQIVTWPLDQLIIQTVILFYVGTMLRNIPSNKTKNEPQKNFKSHIKYVKCRTMNFNSVVQKFSSNLWYNEVFLTMSPLSYGLIAKQVYLISQSFIVISFLYFVVNEYQSIVELVWDKDHL